MVTVWVFRTPFDQILRLYKTGWSQFGLWGPYLVTIWVSGPDFGPHFDRHVRFWSPFGSQDFGVMDPYPVQCVGTRRTKAKNIRLNDGVELAQIAKQFTLPYFGSLVS